MRLCGVGICGWFAAETGHAEVGVVRKFLVGRIGALRVLCGRIQGRGRLLREQGVRGSSHCALGRIMRKLEQ